MIKTSICIIGGGNLAHVVGGYLAAKPDSEVRLLTRHPERWQADRTITITDCNNKVFKAHFTTISDDPSVTVKGVHIVLLCLPGFAIAPVLESIKPYLDSSTLVGSVVSSTGFFMMAQKILPSTVQLFGFQRVPFIARINEYGKSACLLGYKPSLSYATFNAKNHLELDKTLSELFDVPVHWLDSYLKVTLTNSNPLLHPCRLFGLFGQGTEKYDKPALFYEEWDNFSSQILIDCDREFGVLLDKIGISRKDIPSILDYYESHDAQSLTDKIRSIEAFKGLKAPMKELDKNCFVPDWENRYFTEDIPFGLLIIKAFAAKNSIDTPSIDSVLEWAQSKMGKEYMVNKKLIGKDISETIARFFD